MTAADPDDDTREQLEDSYSRPVSRPPQVSKPAPPARPGAALPPPSQGWGPPPGQQWRPPPGQPWVPPRGQVPDSPPAEGWGPPPGEAWGPPAGQPWGPAPGYWPPAAQYPTNPLVVTAAVVLLVLGLLITLLGILGLVAGVFAAAVIEGMLTPEMAGAFDLSAFTTIIYVAFGTVLVIGALHLLSSIAIFMHKGWGRAIGIVLALPGTLIGVVGAVGAIEEGVSGLTPGEAAVVPGLVALAYGVTLFALIAGGDHFRRRYRR